MGNSYEQTYWSKRRISRRGMLRGSALGLGGLAGAALIGCGGDDESPSNGGTATPGGSGDGTATPTQTPPPGLLAPTDDTTAQAVRGGIWNGFETSDVPNLDPLRSPSFRTQVIGSFIYPTLLTFEPGLNGEPPSGEVMPWLASEYEYAEPTKLIMKLQPNAKWDDRAPTEGRQVIADDVVFSWETSEANSNRRGVLANSVDSSAPITDIVAIDDNTVEINTARPFGPLLAGLAFAWGLLIMPREADGGFDPLVESRGANPWRLKRYDAGVRFEMERNPNFWNPDIPLLDGVNLPILGEYAQRIAQFRAGNIDAGAIQQPDIVSTKEEIEELQVSLGKFTQACQYLMFGLRPGSPFLDERVRQAVSMSIDRDGYIDAFGEVESFQAADWPVDKRYHNVGISAGFDGYWLDPTSDAMGDAKQYFEYNPDEVHKLMSAAGQNPLDTTLNVIATAQYGTNFPDRGEAYAGMLNATGAFNVRINNPDYTTQWVSDYYTARGDFDGIGYQANSAPAHPAYNLLQHYTSASPLSKVAFQGDASSVEGTAESDDLVNRALGSLDQEEQVELIHEFQRLNGRRQIAVSEAGATRPYQLSWPWAKNYAGVSYVSEELAMTVWTRRWLDETLRA